MSPDLPEPLDLHAPGLYLNRELSQLEFNFRVLAQAQDPSVPLLERLKYLCISCTNLDEFFEIRAATVRTAQQFGGPLPPDGIPPTQALELIHDKAASLVEEQYRYWNETLRPALHEAGIDVLIEKPIATSLEEADALIRLARQRHRIAMVGHLERFNPAALALEPLLSDPRFIDSSRLAPFKPRATDVSVLLDLMIHDVDLILSLVDSELESVDCSGARVLTSDIDIANARIRFANGCVANVTASRVSAKSERKMRVFQNQACHSLDFQARTLTTYRGTTDPQAEPEQSIERHEQSFGEADPLFAEIVDFVDSIRHNRPPKVSGEAGRRALEAVQRITEATRLIS